MNMRIIGGTIAVFLVAAVFTFLYMKKKAPPPATGLKPKADYVVAKDALTPRIPITESMVELITEDEPPDQAFFSNVNDVVGRSVSAPVAKGDRIRKDVISSSAKTFPIPYGMRAIPLFQNPNTSAAGLITVGDRVDVLVVYADKQSGDSVARTVAQSCEVLSIDAPGAPPPAPESKEGGKAKAKGKEAEPAAPAGEPMLRVVLAVAPTDAVKITAAASKGDIRLILRNPENLMAAQVEEEYEHPHRVHKHYPMEAPPSPENLRPWSGAKGVSRAGGPAQRAPAATPPAPTLPPAGAGMPLPAGFGPKPAGKSVEVIRGTEKETIPVRE